MFTRSHYITLLVSCLIAVPLFSQPNTVGYPFITNHHFSETGGSEQNWCITRDHRGIIYVGNHQIGILEYDGHNWRTIRVPEGAPVRSLVTGDDGVVYAGVEDDFGKLMPDATGNLYYHSLLDSSVRSKHEQFVIWKTYYGKGKVYYCSDSVIFVYDPLKEQISEIKATEHHYFSFWANNELYISDLAMGLAKYSEGEFIPVPGGDQFINKSIYSLTEFDSSHLIIGTYEYGLFLFDSEQGKVVESFPESGLNERLKSKMITAIVADREHIYVGVAFEGVFVLNRAGELVELLSEKEGLADQTITNLFLDDGKPDSASLWISHWMGISGVEINSPFRSTPIGATTTGPDGRQRGEVITDVTEYNKRRFVATVEGLYFQDNQGGVIAYKKIPDIQTLVFDLQVVDLPGGKEILLASTPDTIHVIDEQLKVGTLESRLFKNEMSLKLGRDFAGRHIHADPHIPGLIYTGDDRLVGIQYSRGGWEVVYISEPIPNEIYQINIDPRGQLWVNTQEELLRLDPNPKGESSIKTRDVIGLPDEGRFWIYTDPLNGDILLTSNSGMYRFNAARDTFLYDVHFNTILKEAIYIEAIHQDSDGDYWFSFQRETGEWKIVVASRDSLGFNIHMDRPFKRLPEAGSVVTFFTDSQGKNWLSKSDMLIHVNKTSLANDSAHFPVLVRQVKLFGDSIIYNGAHSAQNGDSQPRIRYQYHHLEFQWSAPLSIVKDQAMFSYSLFGLNDTWSPWDTKTSAKFTNLKPGKYSMLVKARNVYGDEGQPTNYSFTILKPWYTTIAAFLSYVILFALIISSIIFYTNKLKSKNLALESKNREIEYQNEELESMNEEISAQRDLIHEQNNAMTDSIHYARRIQDAVLPSLDNMETLLPDHFIFYKPRDIVSGDFYWIDRKGDTVLIAIADCTGHGVPGAFMSMLGISLLNEISNKYSSRPTHEIMNEMRDRIIASLKQKGDKYEARDGIEMGLLAINTHSRKIQFTGANHNLCIFQKGNLVEIKGERMPVGIHPELDTMFSSHQLELHRGDTLYLFSDGYPDQFGGERRKKYGSARLKRLLTDLQQKSMPDQKNAIASEFKAWRGKHEQIDDVLVFGIQL